MNSQTQTQEQACQSGVSAGRAAAYILAKGEGQYSEVDDSLFVHGFGGSIGRHFPLKCNWSHDALRFARREDAARVAKALGDGWRVRSVTLDAAEPYASTAQAADAARAEMKASGNWPLVLPAKAPALDLGNEIKLALTSNIRATDAIRRKLAELNKTPAPASPEHENEIQELGRAADRLVGAFQVLIDLVYRAFGEEELDRIIDGTALAQADGKEVGR